MRGARIRAPWRFGHGDAVQQQLADLRGRPRLAAGEHGMRHGERGAADHLGGATRRDAQLVAVGQQQVGDRVGDRLVVQGTAVGQPTVAGTDAQHAQQCERVGDALLRQLDEAVDQVGKGALAREPGYPGGHRRAVEAAVHARGDQLLLVVEHRVDGALGDAGRLGDLLRGRLAPVRGEERDRGVHDRLAPLVARHPAPSRFVHRTSVTE